MHPTSVARSSLVVLIFSLSSSFSHSVTAQGRPATQAAKCHASEWSGGSVEAEIVRTADGDTARIRLEDGREFSVRMLSIDTPETHYEGLSQGYWGERAAARLRQLLSPGSAVELEFEEEACDTYGRMLAHIWKDGVNINRQMVVEALAVNYCIYPNIAHCRDYGDRAQANVKKHKGIFGDPELILPYEWRRLMSDRPDNRWLGNIRTELVIPPGNLSRVAIGARVFFEDEEAIALPFHTI